MGLTVYKPPKRVKDRVFRIAIWISIYALSCGVTEIGTSIGEWLHTGVWHW